MKYLTDQLIYSIDFAERMREYWNSSDEKEQKKYFELFDTGYYYPFGSDAFCEADLYKYIKNKIDYINNLNINPEEKTNHQFKYYKFKAATPANIDPTPYEVIQADGEICFVECRDDYYTQEG